MEILNVFKALGNETRLKILCWLKEPEANFGVQGTHIPEGESFDRGVCVGSIAEKTGLSQSTVSNYLGLMERAELLESARFGKWTYYRRNEEAIKCLKNYLNQTL